jgi:hypothetical protein
VRLVEHTIVVGVVGNFLVVILVLIARVYRDGILLLVLLEHA